MKNLFFLQHLNKDFWNSRVLPYLSGVFLHLTAFLFYQYNPYYKYFFNSNNVNFNGLLDGTALVVARTFFAIIGNSPHDFLWRIFFTYTLINFFRLFIRNSIDPERHRSYAICRTALLYLKHYLPFLIGRKIVKEKIKLDEFARTSILYYIVKLIFFPMMFNFTYGNLQIFLNYRYQLQNATSDTQIIKYQFLTLDNLLFAIDTMIFSIGYMFEFSVSKVRSVEPTFIGWIVCLACYPPWNGITTGFLGNGTTVYATYSNEFYTKFFLIIVLLLNIVCIWSSISLGFKASNLTNRGIVTWGPYKYVRHPTYMAKNVSWFILSVPMMNWHWEKFNIKIGEISLVTIPFISVNWIILSALLLWAFLYYLRAVTEENHLLKDPDYQKYYKKVRYRFIPKIF